MTNVAKDPQRAEGGFTLAEMLIAISIIALIASAMATVLYTTTRASRVISELSEGQSDDQICERVLRDLVADTLWSGLDDDEWVFEGGGPALRFVAFDRDREPVEIKIEAIPSALFHISIASLFNLDTELFSSDCFADFRNLQISFYGTRARGEMSWQNRWTSNRPPRLVRIDGFPRDGTNTPFRLDMDVIAEAPFICQFDPVSRTCLNAE